MGLRELLGIGECWLFFAILFVVADDGDILMHGQTRCTAPVLVSDKSGQGPSHSIRFQMCSFAAVASRRGGSGSCKSGSGDIV